MADLFLSYKSEDRARVAPLVKALETDGLSVWWDAAIAGGAGWRQAIERELNAARCVLVVWSKRSVGPEGEFVHDEATRAKRRGAYLPVTIDAVSPPLGFGETQALALSGWKGDRADPRYRAVLAAARGMVGDTAAALVPPAHAPSRRALIGGGAALGVAALAGGGWWLMRPGSASAADTSIAVLPFANLSGDPAQAYFSDGIAEELRSALATVAGLKVAARTSSELMRDTDIKEAATKLGVANILTGSVRRGDGKIRVTAQLLDGQTGLESWSEAYDRPAGDVLDVQTGIAQSVANALRLQFGRAAALVGGTKNPAAYDAYLRASANKLVDNAGYFQALADIDRALVADPDFALAHAFRALQLVNLASNLNQPSKLQEAIVSANRAIELAPTLRLAYSVIGRAKQLLFDIKGAELAFAKAATLPLQTGRGLVFEALFQAEMGRSKAAMALIDKAVAFDPLGPVATRNRIRLLMDDRKPEAALAAFDAWNTANPANQLSPGYWIRTLLMLGRPRDALVAAQGLQDAAQRLHYVARAEAALGNSRASDAALAELQALSDQPNAYLIARVLAAQGKTDLAFAQLDRAVTAQDPDLSRLRVDEAFDGMRKDPRYAALEKRLGFPPR